MKSSIIQHLYFKILSRFRIEGTQTSFQVFITRVLLLKEVYRSEGTAIPKQVAFSMPPIKPIASIRFL